MPQNKKSKKIFVIKIMGGLGNQMFQYAFIKSMSLKHNCDFYFDLSGFYNSGTNRIFELDVFPIEYKKFATSLLKNLSNKFLKGIFNISMFSNIPFYKEEKLDYNSRLHELKPPYIFTGYFQSHKYFHSYWKELSKTFKFPKSQLGSYHLKILEKIEFMPREDSIPSLPPGSVSWPR